MRPCFCCRKALTMVEEVSPHCGLRLPWAGLGRPPRHSPYPVLRASCGGAACGRGLTMRLRLTGVGGLEPGGVST